MITVNILTEDSDWILKRAATELAMAEDPRFQFTINGEPNADISYSIPYLIPGTGKTKIGLYTHIEEATDKVSQAKRKKFLASRFDHRFAISVKTAQLVAKELGSCSIVRLGSPFRKEIVFGVCGKVHASGRKGEHLVQQAMDSGFRFRAWGYGWPCETIDPRGQDDSAREEFYKSIDYLVVTSTVEGGPMPVLEALSLGVPVIAPDVGWCWQYPVIQYNRGSFDDLYRVLVKLSVIPTWDTWRHDNLQILGRIIDERY